MSNPIEGVRSTFEKNAKAVTRATDNLRPHPSYVRHHVVPLSSDLSRSLKSHEDGICPPRPIRITRDQLIFDGLESWRVALNKKEPAVDCLEYDLSEDEALYLSLGLQVDRQPDYLNDFVRASLVFDLEDYFKIKAQFNQQLGGIYKGLSELTADQKIDVRAQLSKVARVSTGNLSKVKKLHELGIPEVLQALREGEVKINRAHKWMEDPDTQGEKLERYSRERGIRRRIRQIVRDAEPDKSESLNIPDLSLSLSKLKFTAGVVVVEFKENSKVILISTGLKRLLQHQKKLAYEEI